MNARGLEIARRLISATPWLEIAIVVGLIGSTALFFGLSVLRAMSGLSSADDAYLALAAKSLATDLAYGAPASSQQFVPFDFNITSGPPMIVPLAAAVWLLGPRDQLPGVVAVVILAAQMLLIGRILARRFGLLASASAVSVLMLLLVVGSRGAWYYGAFLGEPVTFGFILLGALTLGSEQTRRGAALGGLWLSLAVLTKLIAAVAVLGIILAWLALAWRARRSGHGDGRLVWLAGVTFLIPILLFETLKLISLGLPGYVQNWRETLSGSGAQGSVPASILERPFSMIGVIDQSYMAIGLLIGLTLGLVLLVRVLPDLTTKRSSWWRLVALVGAACLAHFGYMALRANLYPRYFFVGTALLLALLALTVLIVRRRAQAMALVGVVTLALVLDSSALLGAVHRVGSRQDHAERLAIVAILDADKGVPYGAQNWTTLYQFVFPLRAEGTWGFGRDIARFAGGRYFALIDRALPHLDTDFVRSVMGSCASITPSAQRLLAYDCAEEFWQAYLPTNQPSADPPVEVAGRPEIDGGQCNIEWFGNGARTGVRTQVRQTQVGAVFGWAGDVAGSTPASAITIALVGVQGDRFYVRSALEDRQGLVDHFGNPALARSGFRTAVDYRGVPVGAYTVALLISEDARVLRCDARLTLDVKPGS